MAAIDDEIVTLCGEGAYDRATTLALQTLGPSVVRFLAARARDDDIAAEAFARFAEDLWRGMRGFGGRSSIRVWAFSIARNALGQVLRRRQRERRRSRSFTSSVAGRVAAEVRSETLRYLKSETKQRFAALRQRLSPEEQGLLVLRVNERLSWEEIARIMLEDPTDAAVKREAARLRKRFQLVREKLRKMAKDEGLLDAEERGGESTR